ncbi:hypothetical protein ACFWNG_31975 [Streptomyces sp. NPDC058391]|uniref:hypothetical protein n=1 Tax=Streptomyces sp. NPDC058391 TaxID=3346476 RepID=UPI00364FE14D
MELDKDKPPRAYGSQQPPPHYEPGEGCLTTAVRIPVRIVVLVVVVPLRLVWDVLVVSGRALDRVVLRPLGRSLAWLGRVLLVIPLVWLYGAVLTPLVRYGLVVPVVWLYGAVLTPLVRYGLVAPVVWLYRSGLTPVGRLLGRLLGRLYETLLTPLGHALGWLLVWLVETLLVWPGVALWRYVVVPVVYYGLVVPVVWLTRVLLVIPVAWVCRVILVPLGREIGAAFGVAWRVAGYISRAVGRALAWLTWNLLGRPLRWTYRSVCTPVGHWLRDSVWAPARNIAAVAGRAAGDALRSARATVRQARRDAWRALVGPPRAPEPGEPLVDRARTLGSTTIVPGAEPAPEISLHKRG